LALLWRVLLSAAALALVGLAGVLAYVAQPLGWRLASAAPLDGPSTARLEAHVRMLAETLAPRHWKRQDNLDHVADYIAAGLQVSACSSAPTTMRPAPCRAPTTTRAAWPVSWS
jgi:hypothetical protein